MAELECPAPGSDQPGRLGRIEGGRSHAEQRRRRRHRRRPAGVLGRGDQQEGLGVVGEPASALQERPLDPVGQRQLAGERLGAGQLAR